MHSDVSSSSSSSSEAAAAAAAADPVDVSLQQYLLCKLRGHPVLDAVPLGGLGFDGLQQDEGLGFRGLVVWGDPQRLLLLLEEAGGTKKSVSNKYSAFRVRCSEFFLGRYV